MLTLHCGSAQNFNVSVSEIMRTTLRFIFFHFKLHYHSQFALALRFQKSVLKILDKPKRIAALGTRMTKLKTKLEFSL